MKTCVIENFTGIDLVRESLNVATMVVLIFLFLNRVVSHAKRSLSPQFETSQIGPGSTALEICLQSLYWKNRPHVPFDPVQYRPVVPSW